MRIVCRLVGATAAVALVVGLAVAQRGGFGGGGGGFLLANKSVQDELKLSQEQLDKIKEHNEKQMEKFQALKELPKEERKEKRQALAKEMTAENEKFAKEILKPEQHKRFKQIEYQAAGLRAFEMPDVASALKLTDEQKEDIKKLQEDTDRDIREMLKEGGKENFKENFKKAAGMRKDAMTKAVGLLKPEQKEEWKKLTGEPFEVRFEGFRGGRGKKKDG
jgi:Spy/CpxP family protein refolding chaperone